MIIIACRTSMPEWSGGSCVGTPTAVETASSIPEPGLTPLPEAALNGFPTVEEIVAKGIVHL